MAQEIELLNRKLHLADPSIVGRGAPFRQLVELPGSLRLYAKFVSQIIAPRRKGIPPPHTDLITEVKNRTGKYFWNPIAHLLTAAYDECGVDEIVDPQNLKMQYRRRVTRKK